MQSNYHIYKIAILLYAFTHGVYAQTASAVSHFMPEVVAQFPNVRDVAISADETEVYFTAQSYMGELSSIVTVTKVGNGYSKPEIVSFSGMYQDLEPCFSPDGKRLYFVSNRPLDKTTSEPKDYDIWYVERNDAMSNWSDPINLGAPVNSKENEFYPSITNNNNLYFTSDGALSKGKDDIFLCKYVDGKYEKPISISDSINTTGYEFNAFVEPNETFILYTCYNKAGGLGSGDLYISYKHKNNSWSKPVNFGNTINTPQMEYCPFLNTKTGLMYFTSKRNFTTAKFTTPQTLTQFLTECTKYENGQSRLYQVNINQFLKK